MLASFFTGSFVTTCGNSSVGRAQPCQGWGRGFESRFPLRFLLGVSVETSVKWPVAACDQMYDWLVVLRSGGEIGRREGLKIPWDKLPCGFDPRPEHRVNSALCEHEGSELSPVLFAHVLDKTADIQEQA